MNVLSQPFLLGLLVAVLIVGASLALLSDNLVAAWKRAVQRDENAAERAPVWTDRIGREAPKRIPEGERFPEFRTDAPSAEHWNPYARRSSRDVEATYRAPRGSGDKGPPRWDPFAPDQSRVSRIRAARHRPRPVVRNRDYYGLLGLERGASDDQIEQAYRRYASKFHPDKFFDDPVRRSEAEARLKQMNAAMQVLRDPLRRAKYDATLQ